MITIGLLAQIDPVAAEHWRKVREAIAAGEPPRELHPPRSLAEQADKQIARLQREIEEWQDIKLKATQ